MVVNALGDLISTFSFGNIGALYVGRLVSGLGIGALTVTSPMAIVEIAPQATRGLMTLFFNVCMLSSQMVGVFVVYGCNRNISPSRNLQWQLTFFVQTFPLILAVPLSTLIKDSPRWLCLRGCNEEALASLKYLRNLPSDHPAFLAEFETIVLPIQLQEAEFGKQTFKSNVRETFFVRSNVRRVQLTVAAYLLAQMSGANAVTNYLPTIFGLVGVAGSNEKLYSTGFYALTKLGTCVIASLFFVDAIGRRKSLLIGITIQMCCHIYLGAFLNVLQSHKVTHGASQAAIRAIYIRALGWSVGMCQNFLYSTAIY
jgi:MFS family permease